MSFVHGSSAQLNNDSWTSWPVRLATNWQLRVGHEWKNIKTKQSRTKVTIKASRSKCSIKARRSEGNGGIFPLEHCTVCLSRLFSILAFENLTMRWKIKLRLCEVPERVLMPIDLTVRQGAFFATHGSCVQPTPDFPTTFESSTYNQCTPRWIQPGHSRWTHYEPFQGIEFTATAGSAGPKAWWICSWRGSLTNSLCLEVHRAKSGRLEWAGNNYVNSNKSVLESTTTSMGQLQEPDFEDPSYYNY